MTVRTIDRAAERAAREHQARLTKPAGALGRLEELAIWMAARRGHPIPAEPRGRIVVFAGDHGVAREGVSAYPSDVTAQMVANFAAGGAAISVLARHAGVSIEIVDAGVASDLSALDAIVHRKIGWGTRNLAKEPAMTEAEVARALAVGAERADALVPAGFDLAIGGEMGIANTTPAACLIAAITGCAAEEVVGCGTGIDAAGLERKRATVRAALARSRPDAPLALLASLGGYEIAALAGFYLRCAEIGVPAIVDGYVCSAAALAARAIEPDVARWLLASHASAERGHDIALGALGLEPLLDLGLRLGEGSGAALALSLLRAAIVLHAEMATFEGAGVSRARA